MNIPINGSDARSLDGAPVVGATTEDPPAGETPALPPTYTIGAHALEVLGYIRDANRKNFKDDRAFADWAQSWARHATQVYPYQWDAFRELVEACEAEYCGNGTELEPDDSKVSYPEDCCNITFGHIRRARAALAAAPKPEGE